MEKTEEKNKQEHSIENVVMTLLNNPSYFEASNAEEYEEMIEHLRDIMNETQRQSNNFEKELAAALNDYQSALNLQEKLRIKLLNSLEHAKKAKQDKDCKWPYDGLLDSLIDSIQKNSTTKE